MVDYSRWASIDSDDADEDLRLTFPYPQGTRSPKVKNFDIRPAICKEVGGAAHGDVVLCQAGMVATAIGVRETPDGHPRAGERRLWCHVEGLTGAGIFEGREKLRIVGQLQRVPAGGLPGGRGPSEDLTFLRPTFGYPCLTASGAAGRELFDVRDDICLKVGGFRHGQVVRMPDGAHEGVVVGVRRELSDRAVSLWFHPRGFHAAAAVDYATLRKLVAVGEERLAAAEGPPREAQRGGGVGSSGAAAEAAAGAARAAQAALAAEREELAAERAQLEEERKRLFQLSADACGAEVVELNVGGTPMTTTRATLCRAGEGSMLAAMFSGSWERGHKRDAQGRIFLDADPGCFGRLLSMLRLKAIEDPAAPIATSSVPEDLRAEFAAIGAYYAAPLFERLKLRAGSEVRLHGLEGKCELNDSYGWLLHFDTAAQRWRMLLKSGAAVNVRSANLELVKPAPRFFDVA